MIEIIYSDTKEQEEKKTRRPPKNIRQIGLAQDRVKVYVEDYVYTYLNHCVEQKNWKDYAYILLGSVQTEDEVRYIYISGAVRSREAIVCEEQITFTEEAWSEIYRQMKEYFYDLTVVGWFYPTDRDTQELPSFLQEIHQKEFPSEDTILWRKNVVEKEDMLYRMENKTLQLLNGYYIYYERNPHMQEYMVSQREQTHSFRTEQVREKDEPVTSYRKKRQEEEEQKEQSGGMFLYGTCALIVMAMVAVGINMMNNYDRMKSLESVVSVLSGSISASADASLSGNDAQEDAQMEDVKTEDTQTADDESGQVQKYIETVPEKTTDDDTQTTSMEETSSTEETASTEETSTEENTDTTKQGKKKDNNDATAEDTQSTSVSADTVYVVKKGESLESILRTYYGDTSRKKEICKLNKIEDADCIYEGQKIILPD
jgi:LysM repeat protein